MQNHSTHLYNRALELYNKEFHSQFNPLFYVHNIFFVITFLLCSNIISKLNNILQKQNKLDALYISLEYQTGMLHKNYVAQENRTDIVRDCTKELRSDIRSLQKQHEQLVIKFSNLQQECKQLQNNLYDDIKLSEARAKDIRDTMQQDLHICEQQIKEIDMRLQRFKDEQTLLYRNVQDDISRLSK